MQVTEYSMFSQGFPVSGDTRWLCLLVCKTTGDRNQKMKVVPDDTFEQDHGAAAVYTQVAQDKQLQSQGHMYVCPPNGAYSCVVGSKLVKVPKKNATSDWGASVR